MLSWTKNPMEDITDNELLNELKTRGFFTNSKSTQQILNEENKNGIKVILTRGIPHKEAECSRCRKMLPPDMFSYYQARVSKNGYLQRSNAVCTDCAKEGEEEKNQAIKNSSEVYEKPNPGDICPHCERSWFGNWHRHHQGDKFLGYYCGNCNMSWQDHRNKDVMKKRKKDAEK